MITNDIHFFLGPEGGRSTEVFPICSDDVSIDYSKHEGDEFYLPKWKGELVFSKPEDIALLKASPVGTKFTGRVRYVESGELLTIADIYFTFLEGTMDEENGIFSVTPNVSSPYDKILKHLNDEIDLFKASTAPDIEKVQIFTRPMLQLWIEGTPSIGCWMGALHWERELENWEEYYIPAYPHTGDDPNDITNPYRYGFIGTDYLSILGFTARTYGGTLSPDCLRLGRTYVGPTYDPTLGGYTSWTVALNDDFTLVVRLASGSLVFDAVQNSSGVAYWEGSYNWSSIPSDQIFNVVLNPQAGATGNILLSFRPRRVATRLLANTTNITDSQGTVWGNTLIPDPGNVWSGYGYREIRSDDPFIGKTTYKYYLQYQPPEDFVIIDGRKTESPNANGLWQPGIYYELIEGYRPLAPLSWGDFAIWYPASGMDEDLDLNGTTGDFLKHAYPLWSVLRVLLQEFDPSITIDPDDFSGFFNPRNKPEAVDPLRGEQMNVFITPSSNILIGNYDYPAMRAKITLGKLLDSLKKVYNAYWYIDETNSFRLEHIVFFEQGGSYSAQTSDVFDLSTYINPKNLKSWDRGLGKYTFDNSKLVGKIVYQWPERSSSVFEGNPILMLDPEVNKDESEERVIDGFMSDVDLMKTSTEDFSKDGFVMLCADWVVGKEYFKLPITNYFDTENVGYRLQNGRLAGAWLNLYYRRWHLPCVHVTIEGQNLTTTLPVRPKEQKVVWPASPQLFFEVWYGSLNFLVKTQLGTGRIKDFSVFLYSRKIETTIQLTV